MDGPVASDVGAGAPMAARQKRAGRAPKPPAKLTACAAATVRGLRLAPGALPGQRGPDAATAAPLVPPSDAQAQALAQRPDPGKAAHAASPAAAAAGAAGLQEPAQTEAQLSAAFLAPHVSASQPQSTQASRGLGEAGKHAEVPVPGSPVASPALSDVTLSQTPPRAPATGAAPPAAHNTAESRPPAAAEPHGATTPLAQPTQQCAQGLHMANNKSRSVSLDVAAEVNHCI